MSQPKDTAGTEGAVTGGDAAGCDLADRAIALLAELTEQQGVIEHVALAEQPAIEVPAAEVDAETRLGRRPSRRHWGTAVHRPAWPDEPDSHT